MNHAIQRNPATSGPHFQPRVDIAERDGAYEVVAELPGVKPGDLSVEFRDGQLFVQGKVTSPRSSTGRLLRSEYAEGDFSRTFRLPRSVDTEKIQAHHEHGLLRVHLPKSSDHVPRTIPVRVHGD